MHLNSLGTSRSKSGRGKPDRVSFTLRDPQEFLASQDTEWQELKAPSTNERSLQYPNVKVGIRRNARQAEATFEVDLSSLVFSRKTTSSEDPVDSIGHREDGVLISIGSPDQIDNFDVTTAAKVMGKHDY